MKAVKDSANVLDPWNFSFAMAATKFDSKFWKFPSLPPFVDITFCKSPMALLTEVMVSFLYKASDIVSTSSTDSIFSNSIALHRSFHVRMFRTVA